MVTMSKKKLTIIMLAALVALSAVGVTLALYMDVLDPKTNHFNMKTDGVVDGEIIEEGWDENEEDPTEAIPGSKFDKGVYVHNTSEVEGMYVYVGLMMEIKKGPENAPVNLAAGDLDKILAVMTPNVQATGNWYNTADWRRVTDAGADKTGPIEGKEIFIYRVRLAKDANTTKLFDEVQIKLSATPTQMEAVSDLGGFNIVMSGAVIQGNENDTITPEITANLIGLLNGTVTP